VLDATMRVEELIDRFEGPVIVKPVRPLSRFKVKRLARADDIRRVVDEYRSELPFLVQDWVPGEDETLFFGALYLDQGEVVASYLGQKVRSHPPALGGTSMARSGSAPEVLELTGRFFEGLRMSGPVSLELKRDPQGRYWVIEPTVGRTDFWLECCIANGVDLPVIEYCRVTGRPLPETRQVNRAVWIETEMDPRAVYWYLFSPKGWLRIRLPPAFPYWKRGDLPPFFAALGVQGRRLLRRVAGRVRRLLGGRAGLAPARW
jgi:predicted ATP-grasp superfamily ATP-dependent carboligase